MLMKTLYLSLIGIVAHAALLGQQDVVKAPGNGGENLLYCGQPALLQQMQAEDPQRYNSYIAGTSMENESVAGERSNTIYTIPVVFHILHNNGASNISDAQIQSALDILNRDYRKLNSDVNNVHSSFLSITADAYIQFEFAKIAPNGACFEGITRTVSSQTSSSNGQAQVNAVISGNNVYQGIWPHNKYLNIYVCSGLGGAAGYTFAPNNEGFGSPGATISATNMYYNGVFILHDYTGAIGTSSVTTSRALTHEVGHWLNLEHTWGNTNNPGVACGNDGVADTPVTRGFTSCPNPSAAQNCTSGVVENYENYMDYSYCSKMFTQGQVTRMRAAIVSAMGGRSNIWTTANLQSVGVGTSSSLCSADFEATQTGLCAGTSTTFSIINTSTAITSYSWTFTGGSPATSTAASPTVTYNTPGTYQAAVTITTASGNRTITKAAYITVAAAPVQVALPIIEGFVNTTFPPTNWSITNGGGTNTWVRNGSIGTAPTAGNSVRIDYYNTNAVGEVDDLNTPGFSLSGLSSASLTFDVAHRPYTGQSDKLEVLVSPGCGMPYEVIYSKSGTTLQTETGNTAAYIAPSTWRNETVNLTPYIGNSQVSIKFRGTNGYSNYIYLDNINISGVTGSGANANFSSSASTSCVGQTVTFTNSSSGATSWNWNFGTGASPATATGAGPHTVTYSTSGSKSVVLTINGGASTSNQTVTVNAVPAAPTVSVTDNCGSSTITATGSGLQWSTGSTAPTITVTNSNQVTVTQSSQGCVSPAATATPNPKTIPTVTMGTLAAVCVNDSPVTLTQGSPAGGTYSGSGVSGNQFSPSTAGTGTKTITYSYTAANGCSNAATTQIVVDACLSLETAGGNLFAVYPNPTSGNVTIVSSTAIDRVFVLDNVGRIAAVIDGGQATEVKMDLNHLSAGSYHIQTTIGSVTKMEKLIIQ